MSSFTDLKIGGFLLLDIVSAVANFKHLGLGDFPQLVTTGLVVPVLVLVLFLEPLATIRQTAALDSVLEPWG